MVVKYFDWLKNQPVNQEVQLFKFHRNTSSPNNAGPFLSLQMAKQRFLKMGHILEPWDQERHLVNWPFSTIAQGQPVFEVGLNPVISVLHFGVYCFYEAVDTMQSCM